MDQQHHLQLIEASKNDDLAVLEALLKDGISPNVQDSESFTPLYWSCSRGCANACRRLLRWGCDVNAKGRAGNTALMACADNGHLTCATLLLQHRSIRLDERSDRGDTALHKAAYRGFMEIVKLLCWAGADTGLVNCHNQTPLGDAFVQGQMECFRFLNKFMQEKAKNTSGSLSSFSNGQARANRSTGHPTRSGCTTERNSIPLMSNGASQSLLQSSQAQYSSWPSIGTGREPECTDERTQPAGTKATSMADLSLATSGYDSNRSTTNSEPLPSLNNRLLRHDNNTKVKDYHDSGVNSLEPYCLSVSPESGMHSHSLDSQYQSSSSCEVSIEYPSISQSIWHDSNHLEGYSSRCTSTFSPDYHHPHHNPAPSHSHSSPFSAGEKSFLSNNLSPRHGCFEKQPETHCKLNILPDQDPSPNHLSIHKKTNVLKPAAATSHDDPSKKLTSHVRMHIDNDHENRLELSNFKVSSSFLESLQMQVLRLEEDLNQERKTKSEMREEMVRLNTENAKVKSENLRLKDLVKTLSSRCANMTTIISHNS